MTAAEAALALVQTFGYTGLMLVPGSPPRVSLAGLEDCNPEYNPPTIPVWRREDDAGLMELDFDDLTPVVFAGGYRDNARVELPAASALPGCPECYGGPCVYCSPGVHQPPLWFVPTWRAVLDLLTL